MESVDSFSIPVGSLGNSPLFKLYTQLSLCFALPQDSAKDQNHIVGILNNGLQRMSEAFPWVSGQVTFSEEDSGTYRIVPLKRKLQAIVNDLTGDKSISMDRLRKARFPFRMLDESILAPRPTISGPEPPVDWPVFFVQATFVQGGVILTFVTQHQVMDMVGQEAVMRLLSKACSKESFTEEELSSGQLQSDIITPLEQTDLQIPESSPVAHSQTADCSWTYFAFSQKALRQLRSIAEEHLEGVEYVSSDDALTAFIWQSVTRSRLDRLNSDNEVKLARAVDVRRYLDVHASYPGLVHFMTYHTFEVRKVVNEPLGHIASDLRKSVDPRISTLAHDTRSFMALIDSLPDKAVVSFMSDQDPTVDISISSWSKVDAYNLDFGLGLGKPEAVRRPKFTPVESLVFFMPRAPNGEVVVGMCLREDDLGRLQADEWYSKFADYIG
uniref:ARAD1C18326p n=1 Tax=Blastobotrys adeninivorans TaxID=409370 RepID=A0A060T6C0_BLAAD